MSEIPEAPKLQLPSDRPPIFVSAGLVKAESSIYLYASIPEIAAQIIGDYSMEENVPETLPGSRIFHYDEAHGAAYNAFRLRNPGIKAASMYLPEAIKAAKAAGQVAIVGVTALKGEDPKLVIPDLAEWALSMGADGVEVNGSCPNQDSDDLLCHDISETAETLQLTRERVGPDPYIILKVSALGETTIRSYKRSGLMADAVAAINAERGLSPLDEATGRPVIEVSDGYAGKSGPAIASLALRNLQSWLRPVAGPADFPITDAPYDVWSVGGIDNGAEGHYRVHGLGAFAFGGAQGLHRAPHPGPVVAQWAAEYRDAELMAAPA
jgi:dihydroorotate dehydrogenase